MHYFKQKRKSFFIFNRFRITQIVAVSSPLFMLAFLREKSDGSLHADIDLLVIFAEI